MLPLIPLALSLAPEIGKWLFGDAGAKTATAVADVVRTVTGASDDAAASQAVAANPAMAADLRVKLAEIAADREKAQREADNADLFARLADTQNARGLLASLSTSRSSVQWAPAIISTIILISLLAITLLIVLRAVDIPQSAREPLMLVLGAMIAGFSDVRQYWLGSSAGSAQKNALLFNSQPAGGQS